MKHLACIGFVCYFAAATAVAAEWHNSLYLGNGGYWRARVPVEVRNDSPRDAAGDPVAVRIGRGAGEADLTWARAEAVRVCDGKGVEMLYRIDSPDGTALTEGAIPAGSTLTLPAECPANSTATYYVYFDNPSAWAVPDFLQTHSGVLNGGVETGSGDAPAGWAHDPRDDKHHASWVAEDPHSGQHCLKTVVAPGADSTWIATRQSSIHIIGGARYVMRAWVRAKDVQGYAGWYIHVGNEENGMIISPMLSGGGGTYDWKQVSAEFTAPDEANRADLGTVLWGTGVAWFDDVSLECSDPPKVTAVPHAVEVMHLQEIGRTARWHDENARDGIRWDWRMPIRISNFTAAPGATVLAYADISMATDRLRGRLNEASIRVTDGAKRIPHYRLGDVVLFEVTAPARSARTFYIYFSSDRRIAETAGSYGALVESPRNLVKNPSFEGVLGISGGPLRPEHSSGRGSFDPHATGRAIPTVEEPRELGADSPADWEGSAEGAAPPGTVMGFDEPGRFGKRAVKVQIPHGAQPLAWTGWRQDVPVAPGKTYLYAAWVKCRDIEDGSVRIHAHYRNAAGELCQTKQYTSTGDDLTGTRDWTPMYGLFTMPPDIATFQLHLTMLASGTVWHDGVVLAEVAQAETGRLESRPEAAVEGLSVWPVNAIVKVFQDDVPPRHVAAAWISAARNEREPLQLAVRSPKALKEVKVQVEPPVNAQGAKLSDIEVCVVGYVPIDHKTAYYSDNSPAWHRKYPSSPGACDGWPGMWPDPLLPGDTFSVGADTTQPIWITVAVPRDAAPGEYAGAVKLISEGQLLQAVPFTVRVWDFALPDENHVAAIYDLRIGSRWEVPGQTQDETRKQFFRFMAEHRVCPDTIQPSPIIKYENGRVAADFTEFDRAAEFYFNELKLPHTYTPWYFYCFGWGHPPGAAFGQEPYEGARPFTNVDRSKLRPEYKRAYQACLKAYWDHIKAKGWADKCVLYISDEPYYEQKPIREQMKALCDMVHEVDATIPIYCSTWSHRPEWDGYLDVWGIGHYGIVSPEKMAELRAAGDRLWFTTDGQMCTDTPYCAVERLLPHYCFKYGVEAYEFWGISWLTYDPYKFGWHSYIYQSGQPGEATWVRYPNGDGYLAYPGGPIGHPGPVSSVRLEQAREGVEDYEYLYLLRDLTAKAKAAGRETSQAEAALRAARNLVTIPNAGGRYSTRILSDPERVLRVKESVARAIEALGDQGRK
jgi:acetone carboxylase gamma subunit